MKLFKLLLVLFLIAFNTTTAEAQIWKKLKDKVKRKAEEKFDQKTDKVIDDAFDGTKKVSEKGPSTYNFNQSVLIEIATKKAEKATVEMFLSRSNKNTICMVFDAAKSQGMGGDMYNVITPKNATMFMNMSGMKIRKSIALDQFVKYDNSNKVPSKNDLVKTGNIKSILGFACHEYTYKNNEGTMTFWVTKERFPIEGTFIPMLGMKNNQTFDGFVMELNFTTTTDSSSIKVVKINQNKKLVINTKEYKSMGY